MTDAYRFDESSTEQAIAYAKIYAGENYSPAMETVLIQACRSSILPYYFSHCVRFLLTLVPVP